MGIDILNHHRLDELREVIDHHFHRLEQIEQAIREGDPTETVHKSLLSETDLVSIPGVTLQTGRIRVRPGFDWTLERIAMSQQGGPGGLAVYRDVISPATLLEVVDATTPTTLTQWPGYAFYTDSFDNNLFLPSGTDVLIVTNNIPFSVDLQVRETRRQEAKQTREATGGA